MPNTYGQPGRGGRAWRRTRAAVLRRDRHRCQLRLPGICIGHATEVDHIVNVTSLGIRRCDAVDPQDCQAVCQPCHAEKTKQERLAGKRRRKVAAAKHPGLI